MLELALTDFVLILLPISLFLGRWFSLPYLPVHLYPTDVLVLIWLVLLLIKKGPQHIITSWQALSKNYQLAICFIFTGGLVGMFFASTLVTGFSVFKSVIFLPLLLLIPLSQVKNSARLLWPSLIGFALLETVWAFGRQYAPDGTALQGTFANPNFYAAAMLPILTYVFIKYGKQLWALPIIFILSGSLIVSQSWPGLVSLLLVLIIWAIQTKKSMQPLPAGVALALSLVVLFELPWITIWNSLISDHLNQLCILLSKLTLYPLSGFGFSLHPPPNLYLAFWSQMGIVGLFGLLAIGVTILCKKISQPSQFVFLSLAIFGLFANPFFEFSLAYLFWIYLALAIQESD